MNNETVIGVENSSAIINQLQWKSSEIVEREPVDMKSDNATGSEGGGRREGGRGSGGGKRPIME